MSDENRVLHNALKSYRERYGQAQMRKLIERTAGVTAISLIPESLAHAVVAACIGGTVFNKTEASKPKPRKAKSFEELADTAYAKWNNPPPVEPKE